MINGLLNLIRYKNLLIIVLTQVLTYWVFVNQGGFQFEWSFWGVLVGTLLVATAGNIINDFFDVEIDQVNKPGANPVGNVFPRTNIIVSYVVLNAVAMALAYLVGWQMLMVFVFMILLLVAYSAFFKGVLILGNMIVAFSMSMVLIVIAVLHPEILGNIFLFYVLFAFLSGLVREVMKDVEDQEGDKSAGMVSFPLRFGLKATKWFAGFLLLLLMSVVVLLGVYLLNKNEIAFMSIMLLLVVFMLLIFNILWKSETKEDFSRLSSILKIYMLVGIISMIFAL